MDRAIETMTVVRWGRVVRTNGVVEWVVLDDDGREIEPIRLFLSDFVAQGSRPWSVRSYCYDLLRWWRWLRSVDVDWDRATPAEGRDLVLWMMQVEKPRNSLRTNSIASAGTVNAATRKPYLSDRYAPRTIRHANAVVRAFYEYWIERGEGPLLNPIPLAQHSGRPHAHHNPLESFRPEGRLRYNPPLPKQIPRAVSDEQWQHLFASLRSNRDRALLSLAVSNGARAGEILGLRLVDVDWGDQRIRVIRKGTQAEQWLPVSPESMVWLRLYRATRSHGGAHHHPDQIRKVRVPLVVCFADGRILFEGDPGWGVRPFRQPDHTGVGRCVRRQVSRWRRPVVCGRANAVLLEPPLRHRK